MYGLPVHQAFSSRTNLRQLSVLRQHLVPSSLPFCCCAQSVQLPKSSPSLIETQTWFHSAIANSTCPMHTITMSCALTRALQTSAGSPCTPFQAYPAKLGTCWTSAKPWSVPIPAASPRGALLCKTLSSLSDPEPVPGCVVPPSDPDPTPSVPTPSNPSKGQRGPIGTSNSDTSSHQEPLLGLKKRSNGPVAVAISGGVDSAVAAMLLKDAG